MKKPILLFFISIALLFSGDGMWTLTKLPKKLLKEKYGFVPSDKWLEHVQKSALRFPGGTGSFVSENGLVMTNHHVIRRLIPTLKSDKNLLENGFYADSYGKELKVPNLKLQQLMDIVDIKGKEKAEIKKIKENYPKNYFFEVEKYYAGQEVWLYVYKEYTDIRFVFIPEYKSAAFGGDTDNFCYPRYCLDVSFLRVYENGKPYKPKHHFSWNSKGPKEGEMLVTVGHPGRTSRYLSKSSLLMNRDIAYNIRLDYFNNILVPALQKYIDDNKDKDNSKIFVRLRSITNYTKTSNEEVRALFDEKILNLALKREADLIALAKDQNKFDELEVLSDESLAKLYELKKELKLQYLSNTDAHLSNAFKFMDYYQDFDSAQEKKEKFKQELLGNKSRYNKEIKKTIFHSFSKDLIQTLGKDHALVQDIYGEKNCKELYGMLQKSKFTDKKYLESLFSMTKEELEKIDDPAFNIARKVFVKISNLEEKYDELRYKMKKYDNALRELEYQNSTKEMYPDATFDLRLSFGTLAELEASGTKQPSTVTLYGLYNRNLGFKNEGDFELPKRYFNKKEKLNLSLPVNYISSHDVIGGNSGSALINKNGEVVGLVFDGNFESLASRFIYQAPKNRTVNVHSAYIVEAIRTIYDAPKLAEELEK